MAADPAEARPGTEVDGRRARVEAVLVSVALAMSNAASYLLNVVAARILTPAAFGELSSLLALLVVGVVPAMGLQTVVALRVARHGKRHVDSHTSTSLFALGVSTSVGVTVVGLAAAVPITVLLHLDGLGPVLALTAALAPLTALGLFHGLLQGARRFATLAGLVCLEGVGKVGGCLLGLFLTAGVTGALVGTAAGSVGVAVVGWMVCGRPAPRFARWREVGEVVRAVRAMLALVLLLNLDVVLARHVLPAAAVGEYVLGSVVTKIAYWLPQAVAVLVLPRLARPEDRRRALPIALAVCACIDAVVIAVVTVWGTGLVALIGGSEYAASTMPVWPFAVVGSLLSLVQILLFSRLADDDGRASVLVWIAVAVEVVLVTVWLHDSTTQVVTAVVVVASGLAVAAAATEVRAWRREVVRA